MGDKYHDECRVHYRNYYSPEKIEECACECHAGKPKPELPKAHTPPQEKKSPQRRA
jgi:hypothetical protein